MLTNAAIFKNLNPEYQFIFKQILLVVEREFCPQETRPFQQLFLDFIDLYEGNWPNYQRCQTGYHNLRHAIEVALVTARMAAGHNIIEQDSKFTLGHFRIAITAALFHDAGYLKDTGDPLGTGGKFTFSHVERSKKIAREYCKNNKWDKNETQIITGVIDATEFSILPDINKIVPHAINREIACIVGTADLIAQMADVNYIENIQHLFEEFQEAYTLGDHAKLKKNGTIIYKSAKELIKNTNQFYEKFVIPRLDSFGRKDKYLIAFFGEGRNPYMENITANLSGKQKDERMKWRRIGDILQDFGLVNDGQIDKALLTLKNFKSTNIPSNNDEISFRSRFQNWLTGDNSTKNIGDVLLETNAVQPYFLRCALIDQILPLKLAEKLTKADTLFLLHISIMLHNISKDPWVFEQILVMAHELIDCEGGSILLADLDQREMILAISTMTNDNYAIGSKTPLDKGLSGWVFLQDKPAIVSNIETDERFDRDIDLTSFEPRSILVVPLHVKGSPIGVMEFLNKRIFALFLSFR